MNIAIPFAVADMNTDPSSDSATRIVIAATSANPGPNTWSGQTPAGLVDDQHHDGVQTHDVSAAHRVRPDEPAEEKLAPAQGADDEGLQQSALGVSPDCTERQEYREHGRQEQRREHAETEQRHRGDRVRG